MKYVSGHKGTKLCVYALILSFGLVLQTLRNLWLQDFADFFSGIETVTNLDE